MEVKALVSIGGSEWQKNGMHRVYFGWERVAQAYGLEIEQYRSGNISAAWLDGESISNSRARSLETTFRAAKVWYDVVAGKWMSQGLSQAALDKVVASLTSKIAQEA